MLFGSPKKEGKNASNRHPPAISRSARTTPQPCSHPAGPPPAAPEPPTRVEISLEDKVELVFDPTRYDGETQTAEISLRLKNVSERTVYPPIRLEIVGFGINREGEKVDEGKIPTVLNADNGNTGSGASFHFDDARILPDEAPIPLAVDDTLASKKGAGENWVWWS